MNRPMWFDFNAAKPEQLADFYVFVFGWEKKAWKGPQSYYFLTSGPENQPGVNGGVVQKGTFKSQLIYMFVDDIDEIAAKATANGGTVAFDKVFMEGDGYTMWFNDPEGTLFGISQRVPLHDLSKPGQVEDVRENKRPYHFEIPATDPNLISDYYTKVFGWTSQAWEGQADYIMLETGEMGEPGMNGAVMKREGFDAIIMTMVTYDLDACLAKVGQAGGKIIQPKYKIEKIGLHAYCEDPEGNRFGILQPDMTM